MNIKYSLVPYRRNQDKIHIGHIKNRNNIEIEFASIVDGWNDGEKMPGDIYGRDVAELVSRRFPEVFSSKINSSDLKIDKIKEIARQSVEEIKTIILNKYPKYVSCVAAFIFLFYNKLVLLSVGTISVLYWKNDKWEKPDGWGNYVLDSKIYESGAARFIGRGELADNPIYSSEVDVAIVTKTPIFVATDGLLLDKHIMNVKELNKFSIKNNPSRKELFIDNLTKIIKERRDRQRDDISILLF